MEIEPYLVKRPDDHRTNIYWKGFIDYLNSINGNTYRGHTHVYYGQSSKGAIIAVSEYFSALSHFKIYTFDEWEAKANKESFNLWCIDSRTIPVDERPWFKSKINNTASNTFANHKSYYYYHFKHLTTIDYGSDKIKNGYTLITFDEFKNYINKMDRKIIGYRLIKPEYEKAVNNIAEITWNVVLGVRGYYCVNSNSITIRFLKQAGVLDLWFEPVYKEEYKVGDWITVTQEYESYNGVLGRSYKIIKVKGSNLYYEAANSINIDYIGIRLATPSEIEEWSIPDIRIKGHTAKFKGDYVTIGCETHSKKFVLELDTMLTDTNIMMDHRKEIHQIAEYFRGLST